MTEDRARRRRLWVIVALVGGLLLGPIDLLAQRSLAYPWANLANSSAVWAIGAFGVGAWVRGGRWRPAIAGVLLLLVAVEAYYLAATLVNGDDLSNLRSPTTLLWLFFGAVAGVVFGTAGAWSLGQSRWRAVVAVALPGAVLLAEAGILLSGSGAGDAAYRSDRRQTAAIEATLGVLVSLLVGRTTRQRLQALAVSVPLALIGFGGFVIARFAS